MQQIDIDFEVFKALTMLRQSETHTYNEVIRDLLGLEKNPFRQVGENLSKAMSFRTNEVGGFSSRGLFLPNGTLLRATYKGAEHRAAIKGGQWVGDDDVVHTSPSAAANHITGTTVNGWRFWQGKRPSDAEWRNLDALPGAK